MLTVRRGKAQMIGSFTVSELHSHVLAALAVASQWNMVGPGDGKPSELLIGAAFSVALSFIPRPGTTRTSVAIVARLNRDFGPDENRRADATRMCQSNPAVVAFLVHSHSSLGKTTSARAIRWRGVMMVARSPLRRLSLAVLVLAAFIAVAWLGSSQGAQAGGSVVAETKCRGDAPVLYRQASPVHEHRQPHRAAVGPEPHDRGEERHQSGTQSRQQPMCARATDRRRSVRRQVRSERRAAVRPRGEEQRFARALRVQRDVHQRDQRRPAARRLHGGRNRLRPHQSQVVLLVVGTHPRPRRGRGRRRVAQEGEPLGGRRHLRHRDVCRRRPKGGQGRRREGANPLRAAHHHRLRTHRGASGSKRTRPRSGSFSPIRCRS